MANSHIRTGHEISSDTCEKNGKKENKEDGERGETFCISAAELFAVCLLR